MTLTQFAKICHVSVSTASKAFSMSRDISEQTREEIFKIAKEQNCFKKFFNAPYQNLMIGVIIPEFVSYAYSNIIKQIQIELQKYGSEICVSASNFSIEKETELIEYYYRYSNADGIIIVTPQNKSFDEFDVPTVIVSGSPYENNMNVINGNVEDAYLEAMNYLHKNGTKTVGYVGEIKSNIRFRLFSDAMNKVFGSVDEEFIEIGSDRFEEGGYIGMEKLFKRNKVPEAIFCSYDYMALGAIKCITDHGLSVPKDIAVIGQDNISQAPFLTPELSSISHDYEEICRNATSMIFSKISGKEKERSVTVPAKFYLRKSFMK